MLRVTPGETRAVTLYGLQEPGVGLVAAGAVDFLVVDAGGAAVGAPVPAALLRPGDWTADLTFPLVSGDYAVVATLDGAPVGTEEAAVGPLLGTAGTSRRDLRRAIGDELTGGLRVLRCTTASAEATPTTFVDAVDLVGATDFYKAAWLYVSRGAEPNLDQERIVVASSFPARSLTVDPPFPAPFAVGDEAELWSMRGAKGWRPAAVHRAIDRAIAQAGRLGGYPIAATATLAFDAAAGTVAIPPMFATVHEVVYRGSGSWGAWVGLPAAGGPTDGGWWVVAGERTLAINGGYRGQAAGRAVRLLGTQTPRGLASDDERTQVDPDFIQRYAVAALLRGALDRDPLNERKIGLYETEAKRLLETGVPVLPAGSVWVVAP